MSDSTQGLSAPFEAPRLRDSAAVPWVCFCSVLCEEMALSLYCRVGVCVRACLCVEAVIHMNKRQ